MSSSQSVSEPLPPCVFVCVLWRWGREGISCAADIIRREGCGWGTLLHSQQAAQHRRSRAERSRAGEPWQQGDTHNSAAVSPFTVSRTKLLPNQPVTASTSLFPSFNRSCAGKKNMAGRTELGGAEALVDFKASRGNVYFTLTYFTLKWIIFLWSDGRTRGASRWARACHVDNAEARFYELKRRRRRRRRRRWERRVGWSLTERGARPAGRAGVAGPPLHFPPIKLRHSDISPQNMTKLARAVAYVAIKTPVLLSVTVRGRFL